MFYIFLFGFIIGLIIGLIASFYEELKFLERIYLLINKNNTREAENEIEKRIKA